YLELHIEQGPVLEAERGAIGVVEGIFGIRWLTGEVIGEADHAGPTPMAMRRDALVAGAHMVLAARALPARLGRDLVATVGRFDVHPGAPNIIPGRVRFTVDVRAPGAEVLAEAVTALQEEVAAIGRRERVQAQVNQLWYSEPTPFDPGIIGLLEDVCRRRDVPYLRMASGAGHDAKYMAEVAPTGMIFVPSVRGKSHDEDEETSWEDCARGAQVLCDAVLALAG
ncbi:MAG: hydantoinase/carbamoylase family amidase, partial [Armatimonadetes bacterium]|nr:hydantoinase/carbamoylase family amidase [Armatimonadota bacterium]